MELQSKKTARAPIDDEKIVELYWARDEKAIDETDFKYRKYLFSIAYNVLHDKLDCEECLNDTYLGAWNAIPPTRPNVLKAFLTTIVRRIAIKRYHSALRKKAVPSEMTVSLSELEDFVSGDEDICTIVIKPSGDDGAESVDKERSFIVAGDVIALALKRARSCSALDLTWSNIQ